MELPLQQIQVFRQLGGALDHGIKDLLDDVGGGGGVVGSIEAHLAVLQDLVIEAHLGEQTLHDLLGSIHQFGSILASFGGEIDDGWRTSIVLPNACQPVEGVGGHTRYVVLLVGCGIQDGIGVEELYPG